jgi:hypothetical protein
MSLILSGTNGLSDVDGSAATPAIRGTDANTGIFFPAADTIAFAEGGVEVMRIDSSGNVGIGTSSPQARLHESSTNDGVQAIFTGAQTGTTQTILLRSQYQTNNGTAGFANIGWLDNGSQGGSLTLGTTSNGGGTTGIPTERMRIDSSGRVLMGITSSRPNGGVLQVSAQGQTGVATYTTSTTNNNAAYFENGNGIVGSITTNGSATAYNTSSDYRLKETIAPMTGALAKVAQLKPVTYKWKVDGSDGEGFIAHELAEVKPDCVSGDKDAVDADGKPQYQGIDTSFLVATLTAAIQEQQAIITALTARVEALEAK